VTLLALLMLRSEGRSICTNGRSRCANAISTHAPNVAMQDADDLACATRGDLDTTPSRTIHINQLTNLSMRSPMGLY
jgi:hypothetical protein